MSSNKQRPLRLLSVALTLTLLLGAVHAAGAQVLQPGLQPGLTRAPDSARKISLAEAIRLADQNSPAAVQAEGVERTSKAAKVSAIGAIMPSISLNAGRVIQFGGGQTRVNSNGESVAISAAPTSMKVGDATSRARFGAYLRTRLQRAPKTTHTHAFTRRNALVGKRPITRRISVT